VRRYEFTFDGDLYIACLRGAAGILPISALQPSLVVRLCLQDCRSDN
jgi:hypothetical protein